MTTETDMTDPNPTSSLSSLANNILDKHLTWSANQPCLFLNARTKEPCRARNAVHARCVPKALEKALSAITILKKSYQADSDDNKVYQQQLLRVAVKAVLGVLEMGRCDGHEKRVSSMNLLSSFRFGGSLRVVGKIPGSWKSRVQETTAKVEISGFPASCPSFCFPYLSRTSLANSAAQILHLSSSPSAKSTKKKATAGKEISDDVLVLTRLFEKIRLGLDEVEGKTSDVEGEEDDFVRLSIQDEGIWEICITNLMTLVM
ncbi:hypothetical protein AC579_1923 [Pseudocercospora musae]|uniref:Uncharacterized protein n=1 Tax=Pseudocercospora musae TaxID=113226 RepID=A0A139HFS1_9PEZI|nr:hypothetical protein AC579_1923 [Pseudocercospora musae]